MVLIGSLFVISGGILLDGDLEATPAVNASILALGALAASLIGTTGASMLLIRPLLKTNRQRRHVAHTVVFFIFLVSNIGGLLTPLGDPPLFLGYLKGVPFLWTLRLAPAWAFTTGILLAVYFAWDWRAHRRETPGLRLLDRALRQPLRLRGQFNLVLLAGIIAAAATLESPGREVVMASLAMASLALTPDGVRQANHFSYQPVLEVAAIFLGLFLTMLPALDLLLARGGRLELDEAWQYFWATGLLSSFLDNAPTYLVFLALAQAQGLAPEVVRVPHEMLIAISLGAVFMGANTYIGNGPNFMVRAIAENRGIQMPGFAGYMLYSGAVLLPVFALVSLVFL
jgi:Na+/H+ antiporter NhaD/arsenite permease-like protein